MVLKDHLWDQNTEVTDIQIDFTVMSAVTGDCACHKKRRTWSGGQDH